MPTVLNIPGHLYCRGCPLCVIDTQNKVKVKPNVKLKSEIKLVHKVEDHGDPMTACRTRNNSSAICSVLWLFVTCEHCLDKQKSDFFEIPTLGGEGRKQRHLATTT